MYVVKCIIMFVCCKRPDYLSLSLFISVGVSVRLGSMIKHNLPLCECVHKQQRNNGLGTFAKDNVSIVSDRACNNQTENTMFEKKNLHLCVIYWM